MGNSFTTPTEGFCERGLYGQGPGPEYVNALTSLAMSLVGIIGLFGSHHSNYIIKTFFASLTVNGVGSLGYHWTEYLGWRYVDEISMLLIALSALQVTTVYLMGQIGDRRTRNVVSGVILLLICIGIVATLLADALDNISAFRIAFSSFLILILFGVSGVASVYRTGASPMEGALRYAYLGLGLITVSCLLWLLEEVLCARITWIKYFPGHGLWHLGLSVGGYYLAQFLAFITCRDAGCYASFVTDTWYERLFPRVDYHTSRFSNSFLSLQADVDVVDV